MATQRVIRRGDRYSVEQVTDDADIPGGARRVDRRISIRLDADKPIQHPSGMVEVGGVATRVGIFDYPDLEGNMFRELRPRDEVLDPASLATLRGVALTIGHPEQDVTPDNVRDLMHGWVLSVEPRGDLVHVRVMLASADALAEIQAGTRELSCGYTAVLLDEQGTIEGEGRFDAVQTRIRYNHLALVDAARAGPVARLHLDGKKTMNRKIKHDGKLLALPAILAAGILAESQALAQRKKDGKADAVETGQLTVIEPNGDEVSLTLPSGMIEQVLSMIGASSTEAPAEGGGLDGETDDVIDGPAFGSMLSGLMEERGVTADQAAEATGIPAAEIDAWITGSAAPTPEQVQALADALGADAAELLAALEAEAAEAGAEAAAGPAVTGFDSKGKPRALPKLDGAMRTELRRMVKAEFNRRDAAARKRGELERKASGVLGESYDYAGRTDAQVMIDAIKASACDAAIGALTEDRIKSARRGDAMGSIAVSALFDLAVEDVRNRSDSSGDLIAATRSVQHSDDGNGENLSPSQKARRDRQQKRAGAGKITREAANS